jgi:integrase
MTEKSAPVRITKKIVDATFPGVARIEVWDKELRGFGLRVEPTGTKTYIVRYRKKGLGRTGSKNTYKLGRHSDITADEARSRAKAILGRVATGDDPAEELREARQEHIRKRAGLTVEALANLFMTEHVELKRKDHTVSNYASLFRKHVNPSIGALLAAELKRTDVIRLQSSLSKKSKMANKVVAVISSMYGFAGKREYVPEGLNPTRGIDRFREEGRERYLTSDELQRLGEALEEAETVGLPWNVDWANPNSKHVPKEWKGQREKLDAHAVAALRLLLLTGARLREILHLKWRYVDLERGLLLLPDSKTGRKTIVLSAAAMAILLDFAEKDRDRIAKSRDAFVIKGQLDDRPRADLKKPWDAVRRRADLEDVRLHDLRHTFASIGAGSSLGLQIVGKLLGHSQPQTTARYAHLDADPLRRATDIIGDHITKAMRARPKEPLT